MSQVCVCMHTLGLRLNLTLRHTTVPPLRYRLFSDETGKELFDLSHIDETSLNNELVSLVSSGQFSAAERLRFKLAANGLVVKHHMKYADVALACLRNRRLTGASGLKLEEYVTWLDLISDRKHLCASNQFDDEGDVISPFNSIVEELTSRALIKKFVPFVSTTGSALASKGYARHHLLDIARPVILFVHPKSSAITHLIRWEKLAVGFEEHYGYSGNHVAMWIRSLLVRMFVERGWSRKAGELVLRERGYGLEDDVYKDVLKNLEEGRLKRLVLEKWEREKVNK